MKAYHILIRNIFIVFLNILAIEIIFRACADFNFFYMTITRAILADLVLSIVLGVVFSLIRYSHAKWWILIVLVIFSIYAFVELEFKNFLDNYYSFSAVADGAGRIDQYVLTFIGDAKWYYWLVFIIPLIYFLFALFDHQDYRMTFDIRYVIICVLVTLICSGASYLSLGISDTAIDLRRTYRSFDNNDLLIDKLGLVHFLFRDVTALIYSPEDTKELVIEKTEEPTIIDEDDDLKVIDDTRLEKDMQDEKDTTIKMIDEYILSRSSTVTTNDHTGEFKDYNFIYFLVESFDYMAIDPELTPTLYMMYEDGYNFTNHYTPKYSCTTGESEFIANVSLVPYNDVCTPNEVPDNAYPQALASLFKEAGYDTYSFHNWYDEYYERRIEHASFGFDEYHNIEDLDIKEIQGWQSDLTLVEKALPHFIDSDRFFSFIITSSMHWPYDESSTLGDRYLEEIDRLHPEYPIEIKRYLSKSMELDKALAYLLDELEAVGKLDDTIICLFSDHNPFRLKEDMIAEYSFLIDRDTTYGISKTPFIIYNPDLEAKNFTMVNSTFDQVPTIANLFALDYDPRLYVGKDVFSNDHLVIFPNADWINDVGIYKVANNTFIPFDEVTLKEEKIARINAEVANSISFSYMVMDSDYFKERAYLADPSYR